MRYRSKFSRPVVRFFWGSPRSSTNCDVTYHEYIAVLGILAIPRLPGNVVPRLRGPGVPDFSTQNCVIFLYILRRKTVYFR